MARSARRTGELITKTLDSLVNGVSQQPPSIRLSSQGEVQQNMLSQISDGVTQRPPTEHVAVLHTGALPADGYKSHIRHRDSTKQHQVLIEDGNIRVWNILTGVEATVHGLPVLAVASETTSVRADKTTEANNATANDVPLLPANDATSGVWFASADQFGEIEIAIGTAGAGAYTLNWEYSDGASSFAALTVTDSSGDFKSTGTHTLTFTPPTDWVKATYDSVEGYWIRARGDAGGITTNPLATRAYISAKPYLNIVGTDASQAFSIISVADYSFIVNKETTVAMSGETTTARDNEFLIYMFESSPTQASYWDHTIGAVAASLNFNPDFTVSTVPPGELVDDLMDNAKAGPYTTTTFPRWTWTKVGRTVIHGVQTTDTGNPDSVGVPSWEYSDETYTFIYDRTQKFSDLPPRAPDGFKCAITGADGKEDDNYWVVYDETLNAWVESVQDGLDNTIKPSTMPHALIQTSVGGGGSGEDEFTFGIVDWADRTVGDIETAPQPSFIGQAITDIFFHKNRLGVTAGENTTLSETGEFFNFWPTTVATLVESDPIDTANTNNRVAEIDFAVPWDRKLYLFSSTGSLQNVMLSTDKDESLSATTTQIVEASAFPVSPKVRPVPAGKNLFFAADRNVSSSVYEYQIIDNIADAIEVTSHVPTYIPANVKQMSVNLQDSVLVALSGDDPDALYVYSFFYNDNRKVQSSWSQWQFHTSYNIIGAEWINHLLYIVVKRSDGLYLEKLDITKLVEGDLAHRVYLDSLEELTGVYTVADNTTRWTTVAGTNPATYGTYRAVMTGTDHSGDLGRVVELSYEASSGKLYCEGDFSADTAHLGRVYSWTYEFTKPMIFEPDSQGGSEIPVTAGRLQIGQWKLLVKNSGGFTVEVRSAEVNENEIVVSEDPYVYVFPSKITQGGTYGPMNPRTIDEFILDVGMEAKYARIIVTGDSHLPFTLVGAEWRGNYTTIATRI